MNGVDISGIIESKNLKKIKIKKAHKKNKVSTNPKSKINTGLVKQMTKKKISKESLGGESVGLTSKIKKLNKAK